MRSIPRTKKSPAKLPPDARAELLAKALFEAWNEGAGMTMKWECLDEYERDGWRMVAKKASA